MAEVKSILNEKVATGTRIGAVIRLYNQGTKIVRIPDYELHVKTSDGVEYALSPSAVNATAIQPKDNVELSYMLLIHRMDEVKLAKLTWVQVNNYVYPKKTTTLLTVPVPNQTPPTKNWGSAFTIPSFSSSIVFTPQNILQENTPAGPTIVVTIKATNLGKIRAQIPAFAIDGKSEFKSYSGLKIGDSPVVLEPGEQSELAFAIPVGNGIKLRSLIVKTPDSYTDAASNVTPFNIGRLSVTLPDYTGFSYIAQQAPLDETSVMYIDPLNKLIPPELEVSLADLRRYEADGGGFSTIVAKLQLQNKGSNPLPMPKFSAQLMNTDGTVYSGNGPEADDTTLAPGLAYTVNITFAVPGTETGKQLAFTLLDNQSAAPYAIPIASFQTQVKEETTESQGLLFPFKVQVSDIEKGVSGNVQVRIDLSRQRDVIVGSGYSRLKFVLLDWNEQAISSAYLPLSGEGRAISGWNLLPFGNLSGSTGASLMKVYESVNTPLGEVDRLLATLHY